MHNLTKLSTGGDKMNWVQHESKWKGNEAYLKIAPLLDGQIKDIYIIEGLKSWFTKTEKITVMQRLDVWSKRLARWSKIISYYKRQALYTFVMEEGRGGVSRAARYLEITRQRAHTMYQQAEQERLTQFTPKEFLD